MRAAYVFLATAGEFTPDGKLNMIGGDINTIWGRVFPLMQPHLSLILKLLLDRDELGSEFDLRISIVNSQEIPIVQDIQASLKVPAQPPQPKRPDSLAFALSMFNLVFPKPDDYSVRVVVGGKEITTLPLYVKEQVLQQG